MFGVIEGSGGAGDKPAACCTNQKKKKASRWRPYGDLMEDCRGVCAVSSPQCRHVMIRGGCHITCGEILPSPARPKNEVLLGDFAAVTRDRNPRRACPSRAQRLMCLLASTFFFLPGGPVEHRERGRPRPSRVRQHVRPQQLQTRPPGSQAGAGGVRGEHHGIW